MLRVHEVWILVDQVVGEGHARFGVGLDLVPLATPTDVPSDDVAPRFGIVAFQVRQ